MTPAHRLADLATDALVVRMTAERRRLDVVEAAMLATDPDRSDDLDYIADRRRLRQWAGRP